MVPDVLPPHRVLSSKPIPLSTASSILTTYVSNSEAHAHLHPDALITASGAVNFSSNGGPTGGVVMHNLRRVAAGLRGEYLEPEPTPEPEEDVPAVQEDQDAQTQSEYEREEGGITVGEIGERSNFVQSGGDAPAVQATTGEEADAGVSGEKRKAGEKDDKEARKRAKKEREAEFKKKKAAEKKKKKAEDE